MSVILGVQPDVPIETNAQGGKQSATPYAFHMLPPNAVFAAAEVARQGAEKYGKRYRIATTSAFPQKNTSTTPSSTCSPISPAMRATTI